MREFQGVMSADYRFVQGCAKRGISQSHYSLIKVLLQPIRLTDDRLPFESHHWIFLMTPGDISSHFQVSICDLGDQKRFYGLFSSLLTDSPIHTHSDTDGRSCHARYQQFGVQYATRRSRESNQRPSDSSTTRSTS